MTALQVELTEEEYPTVWVATGAYRQFPGRDFHPLATCAFVAHQHLVVGLYGRFYTKKLSIAMPWPPACFLPSSKSIRQFDFVECLFRISYGYRRRSHFVKLITKGGTIMDFRQAGRYWMEYHLNNSKKKYGQGVQRNPR